MYHLFCATSSFLHHFIAIGQFKLELQSGNHKIVSKSAIFVPCDFEIWQMTFKTYRSPLLCYFKLRAWFHSHQSIWNIVTVRKCQIRVKIGNFYPRPVLAFGYCRCLRLSVCVSVCVCINHLLVRAITHHPFKLGSPNLDHKLKDLG